MKRSDVVTLIAGGAIAAGVMAYAENRRCQPGPDGQPSSCSSSGGSGSSGYHGGGGSSVAAATTRGGFGFSGGAHGFFGG